MASYAKDPRCTAMAQAVMPLLRRNCPEGAGGYGGSYQVNLDDKVWGELGPAPVQRGSVALMTQEFRAAVARGSA
ncbi:hypothetical protein [Streptomyces erythrochromogenes]|uniref:hypothetical protein n=1 Tax=Streptomyces erythrochromogenes TaxID=285574 RepID=UPI003817B320